MTSALRLRCPGLGSQGPRRRSRPFARPFTRASSARVSAQPRYCFHMFLQEIIGVRAVRSPWSEC